MCMCVYVLCVYVLCVYVCVRVCAICVYVCVFVCVCASVSMCAIYTHGLACIYITCMIHAPANLETRVLCKHMLWVHEHE
jgi:hypothetical protein